MPSSAYFVRQADICLRLSLIASDEQVSNRLVAMALEYKAKAAQLDSRSSSAPAPIAANTDTPISDVDPQ